MADPTDEMLMAYADGELVAAEAARIESVLRDRPDLRARVEIYRTTGRAIGHVIGEAPLGPVPERLSKLLGLAEPVALAADRAASNITDLGAVREHRRALQASAGRRKLAMAASLVMVAAAASTFAVLRGLAPGEFGGGSMVEFEGQKLFEMSALQNALEHHAGTSPAELAGTNGTRWTVAFQSTFKARDQQYCRDYIADGAGSALSIGGLACRSKTGQWSVLRQARAGSAPGEGRTVPAGGRIPAAVDEAAEGLRVSESLDEAAVAKLIAQGWKDDAP